jgi:hypothetical protein
LGPRTYRELSTIPSVLPLMIEAKAFLLRPSAGSRKAIGRFSPGFSPVFEGDEFVAD